MLINNTYNNILQNMVLHQCSIHPSISPISSMQRFRFSPVKPPDTSTELEFRSIFWSLDSWHLTKSEVSRGDVPPFKKTGENLKIFELKPYHSYAFFVFFLGGGYLVFSISCSCLDGCTEKMYVYIYIYINMIYKRVGSWFFPPCTCSPQTTNPEVFGRNCERQLWKQQKKSSESGHPSVFCLKHHES